MRVAGVDRMGEPKIPTLLDRLRDELQLRRYSLRTQKAYAGWVRRFVHTLIARRAASGGCFRA